MWFLSLPVERATIHPARGEPTPKRKPMNAQVVPGIAVFLRNGPCYRVDVMTNSVAFANYLGEKSEVITPYDWGYHMFFRGTEKSPFFQYLQQFVEDNFRRHVVNEKCENCGKWHWNWRRPLSNAKRATRLLDPQL